MNYKNLSKIADVTNIESEYEDSIEVLIDEILDTVESLGFKYSNYDFYDDHLAILTANADQVIPANTPEERSIWLYDNLGYDADIDEEGVITINLTPDDITDSKKIKYRVYYSSGDKVDFEDFEGSESEAKGAAEDFASNFDSGKAVIKRLSDSVDLQSGDIYNDGTYLGKVVEVTSDKVVIESEDDNGNMVNIEIPIEDSSKKDQFIMELLVNHKANCQKTGLWEIKGNDIMNKGKKVGTVRPSVQETIKEIDKAFAKIGDNYKFSEYANIDDSFIDDLFATGDAVLPLGTSTPEEVFERADELVQSYAGPDGYIDLKWEESPYRNSIHIWIDENTNLK